MKLSRVLRGSACTAVLVVSLAACGGSDTADETADDTPADTAAAADPAAGQPGAAAGSGGAPGGGMPGASGEIAAVSGKTLQVQGDSGQVAVTWTGSTAFTEQVDGTLADVTVGSCVMVTSEEDAAATAVRITAATDDGCTGGFGGGPGGGERPTDMPSDMPPEMPTDRSGGFGGAFGEVAAVAADGFTVQSMDDEVEVTVDAATSYSTTAEADAGAASVGRCAIAIGEADDTGAVTATRISLSDPVDGSCSTGRGFGGPPAGEDAS